MIDQDKHTEAAMEQLKRIGEYEWELRLSFKPRVCNWSGERIPMFTYAYKGYRIITGPGEDLIVVRWMTVTSFLIEKIKGTI